ncbi:MAG: hypothetical protein ACRDHI_01535, partial [Actinomycetota bacterium]
MDPRAPHAITLQYVTACREGSLVGVLPEDVRRRPEGWSVYFRVAKGDKPYEVPLSPKGVIAAESLLDLHDYVPRRGRRQPTLVGVGYEQYRQWLKRAAADAGVSA